MASKKGGLSIDDLMIDKETLVAMGLVRGVEVREKFGILDFPTTGTFYDIRNDMDSGFTEMTYPTTAHTLDISSGSTNDASAGTGATIVRIQGLDSNYLQITEDITLNGQTRVTSSLSYLRVNDAFIVGCGSVGTNDGDIWIYDTAETTVTAGVPQTDTTKRSRIEAGFGQAHAMNYTVPADKLWLIDNVVYSLTSGGNSRTTMRVSGRIYDETSYENYQGWRTIGINGLDANGNTNFIRLVESPNIVLPKTDVRVMASSTATNTTIQCRFGGILVDTDYL